MNIVYVLVYTMFMDTIDALFCSGLHCCYCLLLFNIILFYIDEVSVLVLGASPFIVNMTMEPVLFSDFTALTGRADTVYVQFVFILIHKRLDRKSVV